MLFSGRHIPGIVARIALLNLTEGELEVLMVAMHNGFGSFSERGVLGPNITDSDISHASRILFEKFQIFAKT